MKICVRCDKDKQLNSFARNKRAKDGLSSWCADCRKEYRQETKEQRRIAKRNWSQNNKERKKQHFKKWYDKRYKEYWQELRQTVHGRSQRLFGLAKDRSYKHKLPFNITQEWVEDHLTVGCCQRTGIRFDLTTKGRSPFAPSLDRIKPSLGYTTENTLIVVLCYNQAKGEWSHEEVIQMAEGLIRSEKPVGFSKIAISGEGTFRSPIPQTLDRSSHLGDYVCWQTMEKAQYMGILREWDSNVAIVELADGSTKPVEC